MTGQDANASLWTAYEQARATCLSLSGPAMAALKEWDPNTLPMPQVVRDAVMAEDAADRAYTAWIAAEDWSDL